MRDTVDGINEQAWERAMARPALIHMEDVEHPSNFGSHHRRLYAICRQYYDAATEFGHVDEVSCPKCRAILEAREKAEI